MSHLVWLGIVATLGGIAPAHAPRPNIVILLADDMRADSLGAAGNPVIQTPHLDALARRGMLLSNAYCLGGNSAAVCTPSRNMLLSGRAYFRWKGVRLPGTAVSQRGMLCPGSGPNLPLAFRQAGYATYHHGKRGNTAPAIQANFEVNRYLDNDEADRRSGEPGRRIVDDAIGYLRNRQDRDTRPFLMYLAFASPHDPRVAAETYRSGYQPDRMRLPANVLPQHPFDIGDLDVRDERLLPWPRTEPDLRATHVDYAATVTGLDHHIGRLLQGLAELDLERDTIVVFTADQGIAIGSHGLLGKQSLYDHSMKVPFLIAGPGIPASQQSHALVYLLDLFPTLCDLAGLDPSPGLDGRSFAPVLRGDATTARDLLFLSYRSTQRGLRDTRYKLLRYPEVDVTQLFDLESDPDERRDLAADPSQRDRVAAMLAHLAKFQSDFGDDQPLTVASPRPSRWVPPASP